MAWLIIAIIAAIGITIYVAIYECMYWHEVIVTGLLILLTCFLAAMICIMLVSCICDVCADKTYYVADDSDIYALRDNLATEGQFFLGSGHIDDELKYFYVVETEFGYTIDNIDADECYVKYTDGRCHMETYSYTYDSGFVRAIAIPFSERHVFYIPDGSIINNYSVDLS